MSSPIIDPIQVRINALSSRVSSLLNRKRSNEPKNNATISRNNIQPPRQDHQIAREVQQVRNEVRELSNRADVRRARLLSLRRNQQQNQQQTNRQRLRHQHPQQEQTSRTTLNISLQRQQHLEHQDTHLDLTRTIPRHNIQPRTELRAWLADVLDDKTKGLGRLALENLHSSINKIQSDTTCCICLDNLNIGDTCTNLPCTHKFHTSCIKRWLVQSRNCPLCVTEVVDH